MIATFIVNTEKYYMINHDILLSTTEYTLGTTVIAIVIISKELNQKMYHSLKGSNCYASSDSVQYFISNTYNTKCKQIEQSTFFSLFNEFKQSEIKTVQEICERYYSTDRIGNSVSYVITVIREENELTSATIEFKSSGEMENFILPEWLSPLTF